MQADFYRIWLTQFLRPNGKPVRVSYQVPLEYWTIVSKLEQMGYVLQCEVLTTDEVSITLTQVFEETDVDGFITTNDESVGTKLLELIDRSRKLVGDNHGK